MATPDNPSDHKNEKEKDSPTLDDLFDEKDNEFPEELVESGKIKAAIDEESTAEELLDENDDDDFEFPDIESDSFLEQLFDKSESEKEQDRSLERELSDSESMQADTKETETKLDPLARYQLTQPEVGPAADSTEKKLFADSETDVDLMRNVPYGFRGKHIGKAPVLLFLGFVVLITMGLLYGGLSKKGATTESKPKKDSDKASFSVLREFSDQTLAAPTEPSREIETPDKNPLQADTGNVHLDEAIREIAELEREEAKMLEDIEQNKQKEEQKKIEQKVTEQKEREARILAGEPTIPAAPQMVTVPARAASMAPGMTEEQVLMLQSLYEQYILKMIETHNLALNAETLKEVPLSGSVSGRGDNFQRQQTGKPGSGADATLPSEADMEKLLQEAGILRESPGAGPVSLPTAAAVKGLLPDGKSLAEHAAESKPELQRVTTTAEAISGSPVPPRTQFELKTGHIIPGILISGINSDLPGDILAQVSHDVYDSASGDHLLIPGGARLWGKYGSTISRGQNRAVVIWSRIIFPDGSTLDLPGLEGIDKVGQTGFKDKVNRHILSTIGSVFLYSAFGALPVIIEKELADDDDTNVNVNVQPGAASKDGGTPTTPNVNPTVIVNKEDDTKSAAQIYAEETAKMFSDVGKEMIRKNINRAPTIKIRPGYVFNIFVNRDIVFEQSYEKEKI